MRSSTRKLLELKNTPRRNATHPKTPVLAPHASACDPVRQRLDTSFNSVAEDRSVAASDGCSPLAEPRHKLGELQRDLELRRSAERGASTSRAAAEQLQVHGSGIRRNTKSDAGHAQRPWALPQQQLRPSSSLESGAQHSHQQQRLHLGGAALHGSLDLGRAERGHARNSEVSVSALLGHTSSLHELSPEQQERLRPAAALAGESPTKAVLERHTQRRGRGSPRRASRLQWGAPPASPEAATARRAKSLSPSKKPVLARLDVENLEVFPEGPDSCGNTPNRAALGDVTPSHNRKVRLPRFHVPWRALKSCVSGALREPAAWPGLQVSVSRASQYSRCNVGGLW